MASHTEPRIYVSNADAAIVKGTAVKFGTDFKHVAKCTAASDKSCGIAQNDVSTAEDLVEVARPGGGAKALAGGSINTGDLLTATTDGSLIVGSAGNRLVAVAMQDALINDIFSVEVALGTI